jgi:hypothetical protein
MRGAGASGLSAGVTLGLRLLRRVWRPVAGRRRPPGAARAGVPRAYLDAFAGDPGWELGQPLAPPAGGDPDRLPWWAFLPIDPATGVDSGWWWGL